MKVEFSKKAEKQLSRFDNAVQKRIRKYLDEVAALDDPRSRGKMLAGNLSGAWRYRIGDYRAICKIVDDKIIIYVLEVGHRREVYE